MEDFSLVEADFQQFYNINLLDYYNQHLINGTGFLRYGRLFSNLPTHSRILSKLEPVNSWTIENETLSRILHQLQALNTAYYNTHRKKGAKAEKTPPQYEPDYITTAKKEYKEQQEEQKSQKQNIDESTKRFWEQRTGIDMQ